MERVSGVNVLDLFSGIGGFSLGLERAGMRTIAFCEIDPYCRKVLRKHWPDVPIYEDVRCIDASAITDPIDLVCGGFPCQPFSLAGKRCGEADDRHLWPEMFRIVQAFRSSWVIGENVAGIISMGLDQVLSDLESIGYACQTLVVPAVAVDAPHRRDRVWIIAHSNGERREEHHIPTIADRERFYYGGNHITTVSDPDNRGGAVRRHGQFSTVEEVEKHRGDHGRRAAEYEPGKWWMPEPGVGRVANGIPHRVDRLRALGNAVVPQVVEVIGRAIMEVEK